MKNWLIITTSNDKWEISEGVHIICHNTKDEAIKLLKESLPHWEVIKSVVEVKSKTPTTFFTQPSITE